MYDPLLWFQLVAFVSIVTFLSQGLCWFIDARCVLARCAGAQSGRHALALLSFTTPVMWFHVVSRVFFTAYLAAPGSSACLPARCAVVASRPRSTCAQKKSMPYSSSLSSYPPCRYQTPPSHNSESQQRRPGCKTGASSLHDGQSTTSDSSWLAMAS